jgi:tetratricopeptide (TPR) repeat protein
MAASYATSALDALGFDVQNCCNELAFWVLRADDYPDAYEAWNAAFCHRNTPPTVHDVEWCNALELIGLSLHIDNRSAEAGTYLQEALAYKERTLSHGNRRVYESLVGIARALVAQSKYMDAEAYFRRALDGYRRLFPEENKELLQITNEFAYSLACQGTSRTVREAEALARKTLRIREKLLGRTQQETVESVWTLGFVVEKAGRRGDARHLYERAYREGGRLLGQEHVDVLDYRSDLERLGRENDEVVQCLLF